MEKGEERKKGEGVLNPTLSFNQNEERRALKERPSADPSGESS